jgi:hypothetical protein
VPLDPNAHEQNHVAFTQSKGPNGADEAGVDVDMHAPDEITKGELEDANESSATAAPSVPGPVHSEARQRQLFELASQLYQSVRTLKCPNDREMYAREIEQVSHRTGWLVSEG